MNDFRKDTDIEIAKDHIIMVVDPQYFPKTGFELCLQIANIHNKGITFLYLDNNKKKSRQDTDSIRNTLNEWCFSHRNEINGSLCYQILSSEDEESEQEYFTNFIEENEERAVVFELMDKRENPDCLFPNCKRILKFCRQLRIPYYFVKSGQKISFERVLVPVGFLIEEREKGVFSSGMGRFFQSEILLMTANDYGSRAKENTQGIQTLLDKFRLKYTFVKAEKNSFKVEIEAMGRAKELNADLLLISASREYGMDDLIFGPKEQKVIQKSEIPIMVINPRKDLYALCD